jgi:oligopeptide transport system permease protein
VFDLGPSLQYDDWTVNEIIAGALPSRSRSAGRDPDRDVHRPHGAGSSARSSPTALPTSRRSRSRWSGISLPSFVIGTVLLLLFGVWVSLFPVAEWGTARALVLPGHPQPPVRGVHRPAHAVRHDRGARERLHPHGPRQGRERAAVLLKHALKNAFLPVLSYLGPATAFAMTGSFIVERVFTVPGLGQHFVNAVQNKDLFLIMGVVLIFATMLIVFNLIVDVLYRFVDPRIG